MIAYSAYLASLPVLARWELNDALVADGETCADSKGVANLTYFEHGDPFSTVASPIIGDTQAVVFANDPRAFLGSVPAAIEPSADRALLAWVYFDNATGFDYFFSVFKDATNYWHVYRNSDVIEARIEIGGVSHSVMSTAGSITHAGWHMVGVHNGGVGDRKLSVNGIDRTAASSNTIGTVDVGVCLAARTDRSADMTGRLADVAFLENITIAQALAAYHAGVSELTPRYDIYHRDTPTGADTLVGITTDDVLTFSIDGLAADSVGYYWINPITPCGVGNSQGVAKRLRKAALDGAANLIAPAPNAPYGLALTLGAGGQVTASWRYRGDGAEADAGQFFVYVAEGAAAFDFNTPTHTVGSVRVSSSQDLGTFADGATVRCVVRAATGAGVAETNTVEATAVADATAPAAPVTISAEVVSV